MYYPCSEAFIVSQLVLNLCHKLHKKKPSADEYKTRTLLSS